MSTSVRNVLILHAYTKGGYGLNKGSFTRVDRRIRFFDDVHRIYSLEFYGRISTLLIELKAGIMPLGQHHEVLGEQWYKRMIPCKCTLIYLQR